ncbi:MAG: AAA family ATPase [Candidatus Rokubacteria bacterium]|nr:AAA family ATPase [Candidatus Rokubacteria bacterium]
MKCPRCQHENDAHARFCVECGARVIAKCPSCSADLLPGSRFCHRCGTPAGPGETAQPRFASPDSYTPRHLAERILAARSALEGERKQVTVLFADLKSSMELLADRDPEEARALVDPVLEHMIAAVHQYEGTVNQIMGDGIMALFGAPLAHEDHAVRACYAALAMQARIQRYTEEVRRVHGCEVQIRVGLHSGEVVVRAISNDLHMDYSAVGQTTHLAARMEQLALPATIRLTSETLRLAEGFVEVKALGPIPVKGLPGPVEVFELVGVPPTRTRLQAAVARGLTPFVGRQTEMEGVHRALQRTSAGHGQVVAVVGEPGVGKSRLFYEFIHSHRTQGWLILESRCVSYGTTTPYLPLTDLLKGYFRIGERDDPRDVREKITGKVLTLDEALQPAIPALLVLLDVPVEDPRWEMLDPPARRRRTLDAVRHLFVRESQRHPIILVFEDLHWIDAETQAFLDLLVDSIPAARLLLLVNYRHEYQNSWPGKSYCTQLRIDPLPRQNAEELLASLLGGGSRLASLKRLLIERTDANPFFLEETVRTLVETGALAGVPGRQRLEGAIAKIRVPATVQAVLADRIDRLPPAGKRLLQSAAVIGKDVPFRLLQAIVEAPEDEIQRGLAHLQAAEFLYDLNRVPELEYTFKHSLTHEVAYGSLLQEQRRALHARIVEAVETQDADRLGEHVERLAHHAVNGELWGKAFGYLRQAGARAFSHSAPEAAAAWFARALDVLQRLPKTRQTVEAGIDLRLELRYALIPLGRFTEVLGCLREAEGLAVELGDQRRLGLVHSFLTNYFQVVGDAEQGLEYGRRALSIAVAQGDLAGQVTSTAFLASAHFTLADFREAIDLGRRTVGLLRGDAVYQRFGMANLPSVYARVSSARALSELGEFEEGLALAEEGREIAERAGHTVSLPLAWFGIGYVHVRKGEPESAVRVLERAVELSRGANVLWFRHIASTLASAYVLAGRLGEALQLLEEASEQAESIGLAGSPLGHGVRLLAHGEALLMGGEVAEAAALGAQALQFLEGIRARGFAAWALRLRGMIAASGHPPGVGEAEDLFRQALERAEQLGMRPLAAHCHLGLGRLYVKTAQRDRAHAQVLAAIQLFGALGMASWVRHGERELARETIT